MNTTMRYRHHEKDRDTVLIYEGVGFGYGGAAGKGSHRGSCNVWGLELATLNEDGVYEYYCYTNYLYVQCVEHKIKCEKENKPLRYQLVDVEKRLPKYAVSCKVLINEKGSLSTENANYIDDDKGGEFRFCDTATYRPLQYVTHWLEWLPKIETELDILKREAIERGYAWHLDGKWQWMERIE